MAPSDTIFNEKWGSWHIAYYGTRGYYAPFILTSGLRVSTQRHMIPRCEQTICLSPSIEYAAHPRHTSLWRDVINDDEKCRYYQLVFQCRVNPDIIGQRQPETLLRANRKATSIDKNFHNEELEWIIHDKLITKIELRANIICYGLMVRVIDCEPKDLSILNWWKDTHQGEY